MAAEVDQMVVKEEEYLDVLTKTGEKTGFSKPRGEVHRDGDYHRAVHVWIFAESTQELLLQRRVDEDLWDISSSGHVSAGESSLIAAMRELQEELGITLPKDAFEFIYESLQERTYKDGAFDNEYDDVYLVTIVEPIPLEAFTLQESEVSDVKYMSFEEYKRVLAEEHPHYLSFANDEYGQQLFTIIAQRCKENVEARSLTTEKQQNCYASTCLSAEVSILYRVDLSYMNSSSDYMV